MVFYDITFIRDPERVCWYLQIILETEMDNSFLLKNLREKKTGGVVQL